MTNAPGSSDPRPRRLTRVTVFLGRWLRENHPGLTEDERKRARWHCEEKLAKARAQYGRIPPVCVLLSIDEEIALELLAYREMNHAIQRTSPLRQPDAVSCDGGGNDGESGLALGDPGKDVPKARSAAPKASSARGRSSEFDPLYKAIEQARKARKETDDLVGNDAESARSSPVIPPDVLSMVTEYDDVIREVFALGIERNAAYTGPPEPGDPINVPRLEEFDP